MKNQEASGEDVQMEATASSSESGLPNSDNTRAEERAPSVGKLIEQMMAEEEAARSAPVYIGQRYVGTVVRTTTFGAFISLPIGKDGVMHIREVRELDKGQPVHSVDDVLSVGQKIEVKIKRIDHHGNVWLSPVATPEPATVQKEAEEHIHHAATDFNTDFR